MIKKATKSFKKLTGNSLRDQSLIRMFNILVDHDRTTHFMNIFRSYYFNEELNTDVSFYLTHEVSNEDWWDNMAVKYYGTPYLWWVIPGLNNIPNPFEGLEEGSNLKVMKNSYIYTLMRDMDILAAEE